MRAIIAMAAVACTGGSGVDTAPPADCPECTFSARVDCLGMNYIPGSWDYGATTIPTAGDFSPTEVSSLDPDIDEERCIYYFEPDPALGEALPPYDVYMLNGASLAIRYQNQRWFIRDGPGITFDEHDFRRGSGHYEGVFEALGTGTRAWIEGDFDFCDKVKNGDCPYAVEDAFPKRASVQTTLFGGEGGLAACNMVIDNQTGGMQVDFVFGSWRGANLTQIYTQYCRSYPNINSNTFTFWAGGVDGPGAYGPYRATDFSGRMLPDFQMDFPMTLAGIFDNEIAACAQSIGGLSRIAMSNNDASVCTFEVKKAGFELSCENTSYTAPGSILVPNFSFADRMEISADCDLIYVN